MRKICFLVTYFLFVFGVVAQVSEKQLFKVVCYNVENYFDCVDDSLTDDSEYLPRGMRAWSYQKYQKKQANIGKVIVGIGGWETPAIVGLCEVESEKCMYDLTHYSGLKNLNYKYIHYESPDARGIDVALMYQPYLFKPISNYPIRIAFPEALQRKTRDILYVSGEVPSGDTLHIYVCHFPSRLGGELESEHKRVHVASVLKQSIDSVLTLNPHANIIAMGDFNDYPDNKSMHEILQALDPTTEFESNKLYNLMFPMHKAGLGSHKHAGEWGALDQIIVSGNLLQMNNKLYTLVTDAHVFEADYLLENDEKYLGKQPFRTYLGMKYQGGFSDHLPVFVDLWY